MSANDVAIVGIGMHPFGRTDGVSGRQQGAVATRAALADAGIRWSDVQFAFGGSDAAGNADALVADLGLTGVEFVNVSNGCATGGSALAMADRAIRSGAYDLRRAIGFDKHPRRGLQRATGPVRAGRLVWRDRHDAHDAVLRDEGAALPLRARSRPGGTRRDRRQGVPQTAR